MSTSKWPPADEAGAAAPSYTRFIPREEVNSFAAWSPGALDASATRVAGGPAPGPGPGAKASLSERAGLQADRLPSRPPHSGKAPPLTDFNAPATPVEPPEPVPEAVDVDALKRQARQSGYDDGYRDGLAALEAYKVAQSAKMAAFMSDQVGILVSDLQQRLELLEQQLSGRIAGVALELARQVVRAEVSQRPELVVAVAEQALATLMSAARDVTVRLHPADHALVQEGMAPSLSERSARVVPDASVARGGCLVESDIAVVDASVSARWQKAAAAMGVDGDPFDARPEGVAP